MAHDQPVGADFAAQHWRVSPETELELGPAVAPEFDPAELRLLVDNLPSLCWIADADGFIVYYNRRWHDYCGSTAAEMEGWGWQSVHDPKVLPDVMARWTGCIAAGAAFEMTFPLRGADGVLRPFLTRVTPLRDRRGRVLRWFGNNTDISPQRETERALEESEAYVRLLLNSSAEAFYAVDEAGVTTLCNSTFLSMMGFAREEDVLGRKLHDLIHHSHPDGSHYDAADCPIYTCAGTGRAAHVSDELFFRMDGTPIPVEYWAKPLMVDGERRGAICTFLDISARRAAEAARQEVQDRLRALNADLERQVVERSSERGITWQLSPHLLSVISLDDGRFVRVNPAWTATLGWGEAELTGRRYDALLHPDDVAATAEMLAEASAGTALSTFENRVRGKDGGYRWLSWVAVPDEGRLYASARDVTPEKEQAALVATRTRERDRLWEISEGLLVVADQRGRLIRTSPSWTRLLGHSEAALLRESFGTISHPADEPQVAAALDAMREGGRPAVFEGRVRAANGRWRRIAWTLSPDPDGQQLTGVGHDVTETREVEERLRQSQKMEAVGQLTGGLAHDFNNLLTGIIGSLELLQARVAQGRTADAGRFVEAAQGAAKRAAALTHRLLAFSRRQTLEPKATDVNRLVAGMEDMVRRTLGPAVTLEVVSDAGLWTTLVDPGQLENGLLNLCINARDAMPDGGRLMVETGNVRVDARAALERDMPAGAYVSLSVSDTGAGMSPAVIERAFDPFFTTKPIGQGTGLGLSMIYGFARQSGGQVRIHSEVGRGTTVRLYLPRHLGEADAAGVDGTAAERGPAGQGETVLVVDDEPTVRMLVAEVLEDLGYRAMEASDGAAGLRVLEGDARIDLLVTDVGLPGGMNGRQVADAARVARPGLKVLFITGYAENAVLSHGHLEPGMHVLTKPFTMEALARAIRGLLVA